MTRRVRWAIGLWIALAIVVWNVVFDRMLVLAGRRYSYEAAVSRAERGVFLKIDDWMPAATAHAVRVASVVGFVIATVGLVAIALAARRHRTRRP